MDAEEREFTEIVGVEAPKMKTFEEWCELIDVESKRLVWANFYYQFYPGVCSRVWAILRRPPTAEDLLRLIGPDVEEMSYREYLQKWRMEHPE